MENKIKKEDVLSVANALLIKVDDKAIQWIIENYESYQSNDHTATWDLVVEQMLYEAQEIDMISTNKAQMIASYWHNGLHSALYQFTSSKVFLKENCERYIAEINACIDEANGMRQLNELEELGKYFTYKYISE
jgi:hypothetical protein